MKSSRGKVGTDVYVVTPKVQGERDQESKSDLAKSGPDRKAKAIAATRAAEKAELASYKLNRKSKF